MARYQKIIDTLIDTGSYDKIYFDHETELDIPYREIGYLKHSALQEKPGKGRGLHKKRADICAVKDGFVKVIIEEERKATEDKVWKDIDIISECMYLWTDGELFPFDNLCTLFVILNNNINNIPERVDSSVGNLRYVIVCRIDRFPDLYNQYVNI